MATDTTDEPTAQQHCQSQARIVVRGVTTSLQNQKAIVKGKFWRLNDYASSPIAGYVVCIISPANGRCVRPR